jgi:hypothetical protein
MTTLLPATGIAQPRLHVTAQVELTQTYDDNLFPSPTSRVKQSDFSYRLGPRLGLAYATRTFDVFARYGREAEAFAFHSELDSARARQDAALDVGWSPGRVLRLEGGALYEDTNTARELNVVTGLETGRLPAERFSTHASASLRLGPLTRVRAEHTFSRDRMTGFPTVEAPGRVRRPATAAERLRERNHDLQRTPVRRRREPHQVSRADPWLEPAGDAGCALRRQGRPAALG